MGSWPTKKRRLPDILPYSTKIRWVTFASHLFTFLQLLVSSRSNPSRSFNKVLFSIVFSSRLTVLGCTTCPNQQSPNMVVRSSTPFGLGQNGCWTSQASQLPWTLPFIFSLFSPTFSYSTPASISTQLQPFLGSPSTALFHFLNMYLH